MSYVFKNKETPLIESMQKGLTLDSIISYDNNFPKEILLENYASLFIYQFKENILKEYSLINEDKIRNFIFRNDDLIELFRILIF